jgi:alkylation response protein AidB-like acyl-CoA dehydrogenase
MVLPMGREGISVSPQRWNALGMNGQDAAAVRFAKVAVQTQELVQEPEQMDAHLPFTPHVLGFAAVILGTLEGLVADANMVVHSRARLGLRFVLPNVYGRAVAAVSAGAKLLEDAIRLYEDEDSSAGLQGMAAKAYITDCAGDVANALLQVGGTALYLSDNEVAQHFQLLFRDLQGLLLLGPRNVTIQTRVANEAANIEGSPFA